MQLVEFRSTEIRWEVSNDPAIIGVQGTFARHALAEAEPRAWLRRDERSLQLR
jgi:hypothetical protein